MSEELFESWHGEHQFDMLGWPKKSHLNKRQKYHFGPYIFSLLLIWFLHFGNGQFGFYYFQIAINLVSLEEDNGP